MKKISVPEAKQLPSGAYRCRVKVDGKTYSFTAAKKSDAEQEARDFKLGYLSAPEEKTLLTVSGAIDLYLAANEKSISPSTKRGYKTIQNNRLQSLMSMPVSSLTDALCQRAINLETVSPKSVKNAWALVSAAVKHQTGKTFTVYLPKLTQEEHPFLQPEQIQTFLSAIEGEPCEIPALLGLHSLRRSEIMGLKWSSVDLKSGLLYIRGSTVYDEDNKIVNKPDNKNKTSRRTIPIMIPRLKDLLSSAPHDSEFVVTCNPNTIWAQVNRICAANGLPKIGTHGLRHSFCSLAYHLGVSEKVAMKIGGWADYQTMRKIYTHVADSDIAASVKSISDFFAPKP